MASANSKALVTSGVTQRQSHVYFVDCKGILTPILRTWVQKSTLLLQNRGHAEVLKKTPSSAKYVKRVRPHSMPECPPPPPPPPGFVVIFYYNEGYVTFVGNTTRVAVPRM